MDKILTRHEVIMLRKEQGSRDRHSRKLTRYNPGFEEVFNFFLTSYRKGILTFGGEGISATYDPNGITGKLAFRQFDDGQYRDKQITTKHPNMVVSVITAKKSWGLFVKLWAEGIADRDFTMEEIVGTFTERGVKIPDSLLKGFENEVKKRKDKLIDEYFSRKYGNREDIA